MNYVKPWLKNVDTKKELTFEEEQELIMEQNLEAYENSVGWQLYEERQKDKIRKERGIKKVKQQLYRTADDIARRKDRELKRKQAAKEERELKTAFLATPEGQRWQLQQKRNKAKEKRMLKNVQNEFYISKQIQYINDCRKAGLPIQFYDKFGHEPYQEARIEANYWEHGNEVSKKI